MRAIAEAGGAVASVVELEGEGVGVGVGVASSVANSVANSMISLANESAERPQNARDLGGR